MQILLSMSPAGPGRTGKQEQEQLSPNHVQAFFPSSVCTIENSTDRNVRGFVNSFIPRLREVPHPRNLKADLLPTVFSSRVVDLRQFAFPLIVGGVKFSWQVSQPTTFSLAHSHSRVTSGALIPVLPFGPNECS